MKKGIAILLAAFLLAGCTPVTPVVTVEPVETTTVPATEPEPALSLLALEVGDPTEEEDAGIHTFDYPLWIPENVRLHNEETVPRQATVTVDGNQHTGDYRLSQICAPNQYVSHWYTGENGTFALHGETGEVMVLKNVQSVAGRVLLQREVEQIAQAYVAQWIPVEEYRVEAQQLRYSMKDGNPDWKILYTRYLGEYATNDKVEVTLDAFGQIIGFDRYEAGSFLPEKLPEDYQRQLALLTRENVDAALAEKLGEIYRDFHKIYPEPEANYDYTISESTLSLLPDDTLCVYNRISVRFELPEQRIDSAYLELAVKCQREGEPIPQSSGFVEMPAQVLTKQVDGQTLKAYRLCEHKVDCSTVAPNEYPQLELRLEDRLISSAPSSTTVQFVDTLWGSILTSLRFKEEDSWVNVYWIYNQSYGTFSVDHETGLLTALHLPVIQYLPGWRSGMTSKAEQHQIVDTYAAEYGALDSWTREWEETADCHRYLYYRYLPEEGAYDWMVMCVDAGFPNSFFRGTLELPEGDTDYLPQIRALLSGEAWKLFDKKCAETRDILAQSIYAEYRDENYENAELVPWSDYQSIYTVHNLRLLILPDGNLGALYNLEFQIQKPDQRWKYFRSDILITCGEVE